MKKSKADYEAEAKKLSKRLELVNKKIAELSEIKIGFYYKSKNIKSQ